MTMQKSWGKDISERYNVEIGTTKKQNHMNHIPSHLCSVKILYSDRGSNISGAGLPEMCSFAGNTS